MLKCPTNQSALDSHEPKHPPQRHRQKRSRRFINRALEASLLLLASGMMSTPALADLTISTAVTPSPVEPGETFQMALTVTNTDSFDRSDVVLTMRYPEGLDYLDNGYISDGGSCFRYGCNTNVSLSWSLGTLKAGQGKTVTLPPTVVANATTGTEIDFASIEVADSSDTTARTSRVIPVVSDRVLELALHETIEPVQPGGRLTYLLSYGHSKASAQVNGAELELTLPSGVSFVSASGDGTLTGDIVHWTLGTLGPGQGGQEQVVVQVDDAVALGAALQAQAVLMASGLPETVIDESTRVESQTPLRLAIEAAPDPAEQGELTRLALTVSNTSSFARSDVILRLRYPRYLDYIDNGYISDGGSCFRYGCNTNASLSWNLGTLDAGAGITVTLPPTIAAAVSKGSLISLLPRASDSSGLIVEAGRTLLVNDRGLELAIAEARDPVQSGDMLGLTINASNSTPSTSATGLQLEFPLPAGTSFSSASGGGTLQDGRVIWNLGTLNGGEIAQRRLELDVDSVITLGSLLTSQVRLTGTNQTEVRDDMVSRVQTETPLRVTVDVRDPSPSAQPGETTDTWLTLENLSSFARSDVGLALRYPRHLNYIDNDYISDDGFCFRYGCNTNAWAIWSFDTLAASGIKDVDLPPVVNADTVPGSLIFFDAVIQDSTARSRTEYVLPVGTLVEPGESYTLNVSVNGSGSVTSSPSGIDCGNNCSAAFNADTQVRLTAEPDSGATFSGWSGACTGTDTNCTVQVNSAISVTANFSDEGTTPTTRDTAWRISEIYIATMGYAPDSEGLQYWIGQIETNAAWNPESVAQSFFDQPLVQARYPDTQGHGTFIEALYLNIFGREVDTEGYYYWLAALQAGNVSRDAMIIALINGGWANTDAVQDMQRFGNRVEVGLAFAEYQTANGIQYGQLSGDKQAQLRQIGSDLLQGVTADTTTRDAAIAAIPTLLSAIE